MALPGDISTIILTGTYLDVQGNPRFGTVTFAPSSPLLVDSGSETMIAGEQTVALNTSGSFSVTLACTSGLTPAGWLWAVTENISESPRRVYSVALPHTLGSTVDISTLTPSGTEGTPSLYLLASQAGEFDAAGDAAVAQAASLPLPTGGSFPGGTTEFLRADQTWAVPPGGGGGGGGGAVSSVFGRTGTVTATSGDYTVSQVTGAAPAASPTFTGTPEAPTASPLNDSVQVATTAYADAAVAVETTARTTALAAKAPLASPALTGTPTAPTVTPGTDSSTKIATTAFVQSAIPAYGTASGTVTEGNDARVAYAGLAQTAASVTASTSTKTLNLATGLTQSVTLDESCAISFSNWPAGASTVTVIVIENATGGYSPTFPGVTFVGEVPAQDTTPVTGISVYCFLSPNGGTTVYGAGVSNAFTGPSTGDIADWYTYAGALVVSIDSTGRTHFASGMATGSNAYAGSSIYGADGNAVLNIQDVASATDYLNIVSGTSSGANGTGPTLTPGTTGADTNIPINLTPVGAGNVNLLNGSLDVQTPGLGLMVAEGANSKQNTAALTAGSKVVANTSVTADSRIFLTAQVPGGTPGALYVSARTAGTSFTVTSTSGADTSTFAYEIFEPG